MKRPAGYSGTPLAKKLGIKPGMRVCLIGAPPEFTEVLGELPDGARLGTRTRARAGLVIWFVRREIEVCAIDGTWSGLLFARRRSVM